MGNRQKTVRMSLIGLSLLALIATVVMPVSARAKGQPGERLGLTGLLDYSWAWYDLYTRHNDPIDAYNEENYMELYALTDINMPFIASHEYEELNKEHSDGRFEGNLPYSGYAAFVEQAGHLIDFGFEFEKTWDGMSIAEMKGDLVKEVGRLDVVAGHMTDERTITRDGVKIERDTYEYRLTGDGAIAIAIWGDVYTFQGDELNQTKAVYMHLTESELEFLVASAFMGIQFTPVPLGEGDMTPDEAAQSLEAVGFTIQTRGGVRDGVLSIR